MDSLPSEESTQELQVCLTHHHNYLTTYNIGYMTPQAAGLASLETESEQAGEALAETVKQGEKLLQSIQVLILHNHHGL